MNEQPKVKKLVPGCYELTWMGGDPTETLKKPEVEGIIILVEHPSPNQWLIFTVDGHEITEEMFTNG